MNLSLGHLLIILLVVVLVFGTKKLGNVGSDLGKAVKGFKDGVKGEDSTEKKLNEVSPPAQIENQDKR